MHCTETRRSRGRPRRFALDEALATARGLFHARGYDAVSIADLTEAIGINPPSFYAAFGSKADLYARVLERYAHDGAVPLPDLLIPGRPVVLCLVDVLEEAARRYAADPAAPGCLVIEGARCNDDGARRAAQTYLTIAEDAIRRFLDSRCPERANEITDYLSAVLSGLSASARRGHSLERLLETARMAGRALELR